MIRFTILAAILLSPLFASAHDGHANDPIKARRAYFTLIGTNMGLLGAIAKGKIPYTAEAADTYARNLDALLLYDAVLHFPVGSSNKDHPGKTRALPVIWDGPRNMNKKFLDGWDDFYESVAALRDEAGGGQAALGAALAKIGATCKGCHDDFRAKDF